MTHPDTPRAFTAEAFVVAGEQPLAPPRGLKEALMDAPTFLKFPVTPRARVLGKWAKKGDFGFIYAPRGHGKTWLAMQMANAISNGNALGNWSAGESPLTVVYFDAEMNLHDVQQRAALIGIDNPRFKWLQNEVVAVTLNRRLNINDPIDQAAIFEMLEDGSVFIIDNLSTASSGMPENDNDAFDQIKEWLLALRARGITVIIVHHAGRNGEMRGASRREDMAHWILSLKDDTVESSPEKAWVTEFKKCRNCGQEDAPPLRWTIRISGGRLTCNCAIHTGAEALLALIQAGVSTATQLSEELSVSPGTVSKWAKKLVKAGRINIQGRKYLAKDDSE